MTRFEERLARTASSLLGWGLLGGLAACSGAAKDGGPGTEDLEAMCAGEDPPEDYLLANGFVLVEPGADCPADADAQLEVLGCTFLEWQGVTCAFDHVDPDQVFVNDGYGGQYVNASTAPTGTYVSPDVVDVCYYEGVYYLPPDHPTCGRPLLHEGEAVLAEVRPGRSAWATAAAPSAGDLTAAERQEVGAWWLQAARLEHASIASFARFSLDLMRLGAPPDLLAAAQRAALDEIEHARLCFSLASGYLAHPVGPGVLGGQGLPAPATSVAEIAEALVREGCIGETLAALDAAARLAVARDPAVRTALQVIFRDESAHAALAWRALAWMLEQDHDGALRGRLERVFAEERRRWSALPEGLDPSARPPAELETVSVGARAHGMLSRGARERAFERGWDDVIAASWASTDAPDRPPARGCERRSAGS